MHFDFSKFEGFEWDKGNIDKNLRKHDVSDQEAEEAFSDEPFISEDVKHAEEEKRLHALGKTRRKRLLLISFTVRRVDETLRIRIISARDANKKEEVRYEKIKNNT